MSLEQKITTLEQQFQDLKNQIASLAITSKHLQNLLSNFINNSKKPVNVTNVLEPIETTETTKSETNATTSSPLEPPRSKKTSSTRKKATTSGLSVTEINKVKKEFKELFKSNDTSFIEKFHNTATKTLEANDANLSSKKNKATQTYRLGLANIVWDYHFNNKTEEFIDYWNDINPGNKLESASSSETSSVASTANPDE